MFSTPGRIFAATALLILGLVLPATAEARVVISSGEATLTLDRDLARELRRQGVDIAGIGPATAGGRRITFSDVAGATNGAAGRGALTLVGGFKLSSGTQAARVGDILVNTGRGQSTGRVAGKHRILARHGALRTGPAGFGTRIRIPDLRLTERTATALNRKLSLRDVFRGGQRLGSLTIVAIPASVPIDFGTIALGGPETTFSKLESLGVQMGIWGASERWAAPGETYFLFPVRPGPVAPDASTGILESDPGDGVSMEIFAPPPRNMLLRAPRIDLASQELSARVSALSAEDPGATEVIATLDYGSARFQIRPAVGAFELMGVRAVATQFIADQLNARFAAPGMFQAGETLARVTVTLHGPAVG